MPEIFVHLVLMKAIYAFTGRASMVAEGSNQAFIVRANINCAGKHAGGMSLQGCASIYVSKGNNFI